MKGLTVGFAYFRKIFVEMDGWTEASGLDGGVATDDALVPVGENHREETPSVIDDRRDGADDEDESRTGADVLPESRRAVSHAIAPTDAAQRAARRTRQLQDELIRNDAEAHDILQAVDRVTVVLDKIASAYSISQSSSSDTDIIAITDRMLALSREISSCTDPTRIEGLQMAYAVLQNRMTAIAGNTRCMHCDNLFKLAQ